MANEIKIGKVHRIICNYIVVQLMLMLFSLIAITDNIGLTYAQFLGRCEVILNVIAIIYLVVAYIIVSFDPNT